MLQVQIESQAVETARMLENFEGSVAALREIERLYGQLQVPLTLRPNAPFAYVLANTSAMPVGMKL